MTQIEALTEHAFADADWGAAANTAYHATLQLILRGEVKGGERLREESLAKIAGVSRTPVRQALNRLASEGVVLLSRNRGAVVVSLTDEDTLALLEARAHFEPYAAALAVPHLNESDLSRLVEINDRMRSLAENDDTKPMDLSRLNNQFHAVFVQRCGNRHVAGAIHSLLMPATVARTFGRYSPAALRRSIRHHDELVEAARAGDAAWVESLMRTHILAARHAYDNRE